MLAQLGWAVVATVAVMIGLNIVLVAAVRKKAAIKSIRAKLRWPVLVFVFVLAAWVSLSVARTTTLWGDEVAEVIRHGFLIAVIICGAWLLQRVTSATADWLMSRFSTDEVANRKARRLAMQVQLVRRILSFVVVILAIGAVMFTFDALRVAGGSLLASAGLISVIAGLAAQSVLGNIFAGMQLAFGDAIHMHDVVVVEGEWGTIEEITLTYVVVHIWDDRRLVLPSTYFTTTPFANWTRKSSELLGEILFDVDWTIPIDGMRAELERVLENTDLWDGRVKVLQVSDATGGSIRIRVLVSAADATLVFDLKNHVREQLVRWIRESAPDALPFTRMRYEDETAVREAAEAAREEQESAQPTAATPTAPSSLFTGDIHAESRREQFTKQMPVIDVDEADDDAYYDVDALAEEERKRRAEDRREQASERGEDFDRA